MLSAFAGGLLDSDEEDPGDGTANAGVAILLTTMSIEDMSAGDPAVFGNSRP